MKRTALAEEKKKRKKKKSTKELLEDRTLCKAYRLKGDAHEAYKDLVRDPKVVCAKCGRASRKRNRVCKAETL